MVLLGLKELAGFKNLRDLNLEHTTVTAAGLKELTGFKRREWSSGVRRGISGGPAC